MTITTTQTGEPLSFVAGDTVRWRRADLGATYPASLGGVLTYEFRIIKGTMSADNRLKITCTREGNDFIAEIDKATSGKLDPGKYDWHAYISDPTDRALAAQGVVNVRENLAALTGDVARDARTFAQQGLDNVNAMILKRATKDQKSYQIDGRRLDRMSPEELLVLRDRLQREVQAENNSERLRRGRMDGRTIGTRFN